MSRAVKSTGDFNAVSRVLGAFRADELVLVHDLSDHEDETDLVYPVGAVGSADMARMRSNAGGLVYVTLPNDVSESLGLPFMDDVLDHPAASSYDLACDSWSSFPFTVSHRNSFTDITGRDRAMTISRPAPIAETTHAGECDTGDPGDEFRAPGHVHLLRDTPDLPSGRQGHIGLGLALADGAGISPAVVTYEMLNDGTDVALPKDIARDHADQHGFAFIDGDDPIDELV